MYQSVTILLRSAFAALMIAHCAAADGEDALLKTLRDSNRSLRRVVLDNGMICLVKEDRSAKAVAVQIWIRTGSIHEDKYLGGGLSHYVEHMIFKGTPTRPATRVTKDINEAGGRINAYTSTDRVVMYCELPSESWKVGVDVLSDAVMNATFPEDEWKKESDVILREFAMGKDDARRVHFKQTMDTAYQVHPYKVPVIGYEHVFKGMGHKELLEFFHAHYVPNNMITVVVGDIDADEVLEHLRAAYAGFDWSSHPNPVLAQEPPQLSRRYARQTGAYNATRINWSVHIGNLSDADTPALDVLASIVGHGRSSRLAQELKEKRKLVHDVSAWSFTPKEPGLFTIHARVDPENEEATIAAIEEQVLHWYTAPFTDAEISKAQRRVIAAELSELETMAGQASGYATGEFYVGDPRYGETYVRQIRRVTPEELQRVVRQYLVPEQSSLTILAPEGTATNVIVTTPDQAASDVEKFELPNGVRVLVREDHRLPFVYFNAAIGGGLLTETEENNGVSRMTSRLLIKGAGPLSSAQIADEVESMGASISTFSGRNSFGVSGRCLSEDAATFSAIFGACMQSSDFSVEELDKERTLQLAEIERQRESPFYLARESMREIMFAGNPYRWNELGSEQTVAALTRDDVVTYYEGYMRAPNVVLAIFGDITMDAAQTLAARCVGDLPKKVVRAPEQRRPDPKLPAESIQKVKKEQAILLAGYPGVDIYDERYDALRVLDTSMSGLSSDLGISIRENKGLAYYSGAFQVVGTQPGMFVIYAGTRPDAVDEVRGLINAEVERIIGDGAREDEVERAKKQILGGYQLSLQSGGHLAATCALDELYGLGHRHLFATEERVSKITAADVRAAARSLFIADRQAVSIVIPDVSE